MSRPPDSPGIVHCLGMQIDAAVKSVQLFVESHRRPPWDWGRREPVQAVRRRAGAGAEVHRGCDSQARERGVPPPGKGTGA